MQPYNSCPHYERCTAIPYIYALGTIIFIFAPLTRPHYYILRSLTTKTAKIASCRSVMKPSKRSDRKSHFLTKEKGQPLERDPFTKFSSVSPIIFHSIHTKECVSLRWLHRTIQAGPRPLRSHSLRLLLNSLNPCRPFLNHFSLARAITCQVDPLPMWRRSRSRTSERC